MAAALLWLAARAYRGVRISSTLTLPLMFFTVACLLSVFTSQLKGLSAVEFSRILSVVVMAIVLERLAVDPPAVKRIMFAAMGSALIPLLASLGTYAIGAPLMDKRAALQDGIKRVRGTFDQANGFSRYLLFIIIMGVALYPHLPKRWRIPMLGGLAGLGVLMILTYTRSSWLALVVGLLVVGWLQSKKLLLVLIAMGLGVALFVPSVVNRFSDLTASNGPSTALTGEGNSLAWRFSYWTQVVNLAADNPVTGIGLRVTEVISGGNKQPHNDFVRAYVELGAIGLMAYILLLIAMARVAVRGVRDAACRLATRGGGRVRGLLRGLRAREPGRQRDVTGGRALVPVRLRGLCRGGGQVRVDRQEERPAGRRAAGTIQCDQQLRRRQWRSRTTSRFSASERGC